MVSFENSKRLVTNLQKSDGSSVAAHHLESPKDAHISSGSIRTTQGGEFYFPIQTLPPNQALELSTERIETFSRSQISYEPKAGEDSDEGNNTDQNQWKIDSSHLENIPEDAYHPCIDSINTTIKTNISTNPTTQAIRQNASPSSSNAIGWKSSNTGC